MKILLLAPKIKTGGVASFVENITPFFVNHVKLFYRGKSNGKSELYNLINKFIVHFKFLSAIIYYRPDMVLVNTSLSWGGLVRDGLFVFISKCFNKKVLLYIHGFQENALKFKTLLRWGYFKSDAIIVLSNSFLKSFSHAGYKKPIYTQMNPVSLEILNNVPDKTDEHTEYKNYKILFLSRIEQVKGIFTSLHAFSEIQKQYPDAILKIAGKGNALEKAKRFVAEVKINNVHFLGYVKGKAKKDLLNSTDIFLFPNEHKEGLPINVLEEMTAGHVIITRPVAGLIDLYEKSPFGHSISSTNPEDFADAIEEIIKSPERAKAISERNAKFSRENFHPQVITNKIESILSEF